MDDPLFQRVRLVEPGPGARPSAGARPGADRPAPGSLGWSCAVVLDAPERKQTGLASQRQHFRGGPMTTPSFRGLAAFVFLLKAVPPRSFP